MALPGALLPWVELRWLKLTADGLEVNSGGFVEFRETDLTTPQNTFSNSGLSVANPNPIELDPDGRAPDPIYLLPTGYSVFVYDADMVLLYSVPFVEDVGSAFLSQLGTIQAEGAKGVVTSPYLVTATDNLVTIDSAINPTIIQLPLAADCTRMLCIKNVGASAAARVTPQAGETIDDNIAATAYINLPAATGLTPIFAPTIFLVSDGVSAWYIVASHALMQS